MRDVGAVLARLALDEQFRVLLRHDPDSALAGYDLDPGDVAALRSPGEGWSTLWARAVGQASVSQGPAWDLREPPAAAPAPEPPRWPNASVWIRVRRAHRDDGSPAWQADLRGEAPDPDPGFTDLQLDLRDLAGFVSATLRPAKTEVYPTPVSGSRWAHGTPRAAAAAVFQCPPAGREEALHTLLRAIRDGVSEEGPEPPEATDRNRVTVVGLGITGIDQVTREAEAAIRRARRVYHVDAGLAADVWLRSLQADVVPLFETAYRVHEARIDAYDRIAVQVLAGALEVGRVVLAVQGHPLFFSYAPALLLDAGRLLGIAVHVQPGISADACLFAELGVDPGEQGIQAYECTDLLLRRRPISSDVPLVLWQVGNLETRLHQGRRSRPARLSRLQNWLLTFYPPDHPVIAVYVSPHPGVPGWRQTTSLEELPALARDLHAAVTLYVPPVQRRPLADPELAFQVDDPAHLGAVTE